LKASSKFDGVLPCVVPWFDPLTKPEGLKRWIYAGDACYKKGIHNASTVAGSCAAPILVMQKGACVVAGIHQWGSSQSNGFIPIDVVLSVFH
jgi:hypothetical protein